MSSRTFTSYFFILIVGLLFLPQTGLAGVLSFQSESNTIAPQQEILVTVLVDTEGIKVNGISGSVVYNHEELELLEVWSGDSIVPLWIENPRPTPGVEGLLSFAGVIPGGYNGNNGTVFSLVMRTLSTSGESVLNLGNIILTKHSETGERIPGRGQNLTLQISPISGALAQTTRQDTIPPEPFDPIVARGQDLFEGKHFVVFNTEDRQSGIAYYEILETPEELSPEVLDSPALSWQPASSPAKIKDQSLESYIYIRAYDNVGNAQLAVLPPQNRKIPSRPWSVVHILFGILVVGLLGTALWKRKTHRLSTGTSPTVDPTNDLINKN
jgi:hypothetical protein